MSTPLKATSSLLRSHLSPRSPKPKLLSPVSSKYKLDISPNTSSTVNTKQFLSFGKHHLRNTPSKISISDEFSRKENIILDSPHRRSLLKNGVNKYDLCYLIGKGSFGTVIKGQYKGDVVAFKLVKLEKPPHQLNENNARYLVHENIIKILDIIVSEKYGLVIMEYHKDSKNLQQVLDDNNTILKREMIVDFMRDVAKGLKYCHENGVLHLDIKPKNVLLCNNTCKICDFGNSVKEPIVDQIFHYRGTVAYTAPEILKNNKPTAKSDIYSLGMLMWQLIFRKSPYEFLDNEVVIYKVVKFNLRPSLELEDKELSQLCSMCWETDPSLRPNASQMYDMLNNIGFTVSEY